MEREWVGLYRENRSERKVTFSLYLYLFRVRYLWWIIFESRVYIYICVFVRVYIVSIFIRFGTAVKFYIGQVISGE